MNPHVYYCSCTWSSDFSSPTARTVTRRLVHSPEGWRAWWLGKGRESGRGLGGLQKGRKVVLCRTWTWFLPPVIRECWLNTPSVVSFMTPKFNLRKSVKLTIDISTVCPSNDSGWVLNGLDDSEKESTIWLPHLWGRSPCGWGHESTTESGKNRLGCRHIRFPRHA